MVFDAAASSFRSIAVVGAGPAGFFAADALCRSEVPVRVALIERLPAPYGLVRYGVAPDHPEIKRVVRQFDRTAAHPSVEFWGGVTVGREVSIEELEQAFDAVVLATGAPDSVALGIPGEDLPGSCSSAEFVGWYNGLPDLGNKFQTLEGDAAVVIGNGNVAMDVARILAKTEDELRATDITAEALSALARHRFSTIYVVGRRGPAQAAWTAAELREFDRLAAITPAVAAEEVQLDPVSEQELQQPVAALRRKAFEVLQGYVGREGDRQVRFLFRRSPVELLGKDRVEAIRLGRNLLTGSPGSLRAAPTGESEVLRCGLVVRCIGYRGRRIAGVPFDDRRGLVVNQGGRIRPGLYAAGWIRHGPKGLIGTNKKESAATVAALLEDLPRLPPAPRDPLWLRGLLDKRGLHITSFADWRRIDAAEVARGQRVGKPREKFNTVAAMRNCLDTRRSVR